MTADVDEFMALILFIVACLVFAGAGFGIQCLVIKLLKH